MDDDPARRPPPVRARIANACDSCKAKKVKCDGNVPCGFCTRHQRASTCHYSPQHRRRTAGSASFRSSRHRSSHAATPTPHIPSAASAGARAAGSQPDAHAHEETEVPREARLLLDAEGKLIFIGDCAPLSFFQTVRQLITTRVDPSAFAHQTHSRLPTIPGVAAAIGNSTNNSSSYHATTTSGTNGQPPLDHDTIPSAVSAYAATTSGLIDLFSHTRLLQDDIFIWATQTERAGDLSSAVNYLVLGIGYQSSDEELASSYFEYAKNLALAHLGGNLTVATIQAFILVAVHMLGACQTNSAFIFFGIAVRAAYSIGVHRTEINARFGSDTQRQRDRLWKSLRVLDLFLSTSMGRPPATSDIDCTVPYTSPDEEGHQEAFDLLNASVQIFLITEEIVVEVYSRKKISYQLTEGISRQLRDWSIRWLHRLKGVIASAYAPTSGLVEGDLGDASEVTGACQVLCSYYYAVILVSRPFLMYELHKRLSTGLPHSSKTGLLSGEFKLADACIDAATFMVEPVTELIEKGHFRGHKPLIVSWLFASSLVLGTGLLGSFGRIVEKYTRNCIAALEHFAHHDDRQHRRDHRRDHRTKQPVDTNAGQYALIATSILSSALDYLEKKEMSERLQRTESSTQLFGLVPQPTVRHEFGLGLGSGGGLDGRNSENRGGLASQPQQQQQQVPSPFLHHQHHHKMASATTDRRGSASGVSIAQGGAGTGSRGVVGQNLPGQGIGGGYVGLGTALSSSGSLPRTPDLAAILEGRMDVGGGDGSAAAASGFGDLNLFQLLDGEGQIDLGPYM